MNNIIELHKHAFPIGTIAYHKRYRSCKILKADGASRKIRYVVPNGDKLIFKTAVVPMVELQTEKMITY